MCPWQYLGAGGGCEQLGSRKRDLAARQPGVCLYGVGRDRESLGSRLCSLVKEREGDGHLSQVHHYHSLHTCEWQTEGCR